jgi:hypothetical protein
VDLYEDEHVQGLQPDGLDREEVAREHRSGVRAEDGAPGDGLIARSPGRFARWDRRRSGSNTPDSVLGAICLAPKDGGPWPLLA